MNFFDSIKRFWNFLKEDTWQSWIVSLILAFVVIKFIFFPTLSYTLNTSLPLVVVESCSMYHGEGFDEWWKNNEVWYQRKDIGKIHFEKFPFKNGLNKGDIVLVSGRGTPEKGDVIIFESGFQHPLIHRIVTNDPLGTKGDNNGAQLPSEKNIHKDMILGKAVAKVPALGWVKLIFFEGMRPSSQRGFCK